MQMNTPWYVYQQLLWHQREPQLPPTIPPMDAQRPAGRSGPGSYEATAFALSPTACKTLCAPSKSRVFASPSPVELLQLSPTDLQSQMIWGLLLLMQKTLAYYIFLDSKITVDGDCNHGIKRCLILGRKAKTNPGSILKTRDITLSTKVCIVKL